MQAFANFKDLEGLLRHQKILYLIIIRNASSGFRTDKCIVKSCYNNWF